MKTKKRKMKFNPDKAFRNFVILASIVTTIVLITKIATNGIAWISTCHYFG